MYKITNTPTWWGNSYLQARLYNLPHFSQSRFIFTFHLIPHQSQFLFPHKKKIADGKASKSRRQSIALPTAKGKRADGNLMKTSDSESAALLSVPIFLPEKQWFLLLRYTNDLQEKYKEKQKTYSFILYCIRFVLTLQTEIY